MPYSAFASGGLAAAVEHALATRDGERPAWKHDADPPAEEDMFLRPSARKNQGQFDRYRNRSAFGAERKLRCDLGRFRFAPEADFRYSPAPLPDSTFSRPSLSRTGRLRLCPNGLGNGCT